MRQKKQEEGVSTFGGWGPPRRGNDSEVWRSTSEVLVPMPPRSHTTTTTTTTVEQQQRQHQDGHPELHSPALFALARVASRRRRDEPLAFSSRLARLGRSHLEQPC